MDDNKIKAPSHVTYAQASRIIGCSYQSILYRLKACKLTRQIWYDVPMVAMEEVMREKDSAYLKKWNRNK